MKIFTGNVLKTVAILTFMLSSLCCLGQNPSAKNVFGDRLLQSLKIVESYRGSSGNEENYVFTYNDAGQVTKIVETDSNGFLETSTFEYTPGTINGETYHVLMTTVDNDSEDTETDKCYFRLGKNNFVEYCYMEASYAGEDEVEVSMFNFEYNSDGQLCKMQRSSDDGWHLIVVGTYTDGNLTSVKETDKDGYEGSYTNSYTSSTIPTPLENSDKIMFMDGFGFDLEELAYVVYFAGMLGTSSKNLTASCSREETAYSWNFSDDKSQTIMSTSNEEGEDVQTTFTWATSSTGISAVNAASSEPVERVYGIDGKLRQQPQRGLNIINGKKVLVK